MTVQAVLFDAVGTLIHPHPSVSLAYRRAGLLHGVDLSEREIRRRFQVACDREQRQAADQPTSHLIERDRWRRIVGDVFEQPPAVTDPLFQSLWEHFADHRHWRLFDDAPSVWRNLHARGIRLGLASNFDDRLLPIWREVASAAGMSGAADDVFCSSQIGWSKPNPKFYASIAKRLQLPPASILLIGDDPTNDVEGAIAAGFQAIQIDRKGDIASGDRVTIPSLDDLLRRLNA